MEFEQPTTQLPEVTQSQVTDVVPEGMTPREFAVWSAARVKESFAKEFPKSGEPYTTSSLADANVIAASALTKMKR